MRLFVFPGLLLCAAMAVFGARWNVPAWAQESYTFQVEQDAWVNDANPAANYGNNTYVSVKDRSGLAEAYLKFSNADMNSLNGVPIKSASIFMYQYQGTNSPGDGLSMYKVSSDWDENVINWDNKPGCGTSGISVLQVSGESNTSGWREWPGIENVVSEWARGDNFGLVLENNRDKTNNELFARFYSSEFSDKAFRPYLKVTAAPEPVSMLLFGTGGALLGIKRIARKFKAR